MSGTSGSAKVLGKVATFFAGWRFPAWTVALLTAYLVTLSGMLLVPVGDDPLGRFAEEFKTWCFGYDPATGKLETMLVAMMLFEPAALALFITALWRQQLALALTDRRWIAPAITAVLLVGGGAAAFASLHEGGPAQGALPFPAERLRTQLLPPPLALTDHQGAPISLDGLRGRVVVLTSVYARCSQTCPMILAQVKRAVGRLDEAERSKVTVVSVTLDPAHDTPEVLAKLAAAQGVAAPLYRLATGTVAEVEALLDQMQVTRSRDPKTGVISHANLFLVIDREGKLAYRFTLGERQEEWLGAALKYLTAEVPVL